MRGYDLIEEGARVGLARSLLAQDRRIEAALAAAACERQSRDRVVLGLALEALGLLRAAARALWGSAVGTPDLLARWSALAALVRVLARAGNRMGFERARRLVERFHADGLPPARFELDAMLETARALARFGERSAAGGMLAEAVAVARRTRALDAALRVRRAQVDCETLAGSFDPPEPPDPPAQLGPLLARLAELGEPEEALQLVERPWEGP